MRPTEKQTVLLHEARHQHWLLFHEPWKILAAYDIASVLPVLQAAEDLVAQGNLYAAGFVAYEAAPAFDSALRVHPADTFPLAWFGIYRRAETVASPICTAKPAENLSWSPSVSPAKYRAAIDQIKAYIQAGDTYQVNYTFRLRADLDGDMWSLFLQLLQAQRGAYGAFLNTGDWTVASASPELFFDLQGQDLISRPMKGTVERGLHEKDDGEKARWLHHSEKNRAENVMIVDMVRNDLGRIAETGTVEVVDPFTLERYPTLWQMTTGVRCRTDRTVTDIFRALFPAGSITGAPKARTMEIINELEASPRRIYTGAIGFMGPKRRAQFNVAIRTVLADHARRSAEYGVGGGIVWDSEEKAEKAECGTKAAILTPSTPAFSLLETILWTPEAGFFLLDRHLERLRSSAAYFSFTIDFDAIRQKLSSLTDRLPQAPHRIRLLIPEHEEIHLEWTPLQPLPHPYLLHLARTPVSSAERFLYHKTTYRRPYEEALADVPEGHDVLLWNEKGEITESCIANIAVRIAGELLTPPVHCGLLAGTYRSFLLATGKIREAIIRIDDLKGATGLYLMNAIRGLWKITLTESSGEGTTAGQA